MKYWLLGLGAVLSTACGGSSDTGSSGLGESAAQAFAGIYELTAMTKNETSCGAPGASVLSSTRDRFFFIEQGDVFGTKYLMLASCSSVSNCLEKRSSFQEQQSYPVEFTYTLTSASSATSVSGFTASTGTTNGGNQCVERIYADHLVALAADHSLHLESRIKNLADRPQEDGFCTFETSESKAEANGLPCGALETLDARFVQGF